MDTHALSEPAFATALEVLAANTVDVMIQKDVPIIGKSIVGIVNMPNDDISEKAKAREGDNPSFIRISPR